MNKKGFTLVEILAVISLLAIIIIIVGTKGFGTFNNTKDKITEINKEVIIEAANLLATEIDHCDDDLDDDLLSISPNGFAKYNGFNSTNTPTCEKLKEKLNDCLKVTIGYLKSNNYVTGAGIKKIDNDTIIKICKNDNQLVLKDSNDNILKTDNIELVELCNTNYYEVKKDSLTCKIMTDENIIKNEVTPLFTGVETEEKGMYKAPDDYGDSWYFRGAQSNNYVKFAGFTWRIVRINGNGTIRLILNDSLDKLGVDTKSKYNENISDNAYIGYMYGFSITNEIENKFREYNGICVDLNGNIRNYPQVTCEATNNSWLTSLYDVTHYNLNSSIIKGKVDNFYEIYLSSYENYIADILFCNDKTISNMDKYFTYNIENNKSGIKNYNNLYNGLVRLYNNGSDISSTNPANPTLECAKGMSNSLSRFTVNEQTINSIKTNGDLTYPIGLLSADEAILAGAFKGIKNESFYLYNNNISWWTMTPSFYYTFTNSVSFYINDRLQYDNAINEKSVRPVINLNSNVLVTGNGTVDNPYKIS